MGMHEISELVIRNNIDILTIAVKIRRSPGSVYRILFGDDTHYGFKTKMMIVAEVMAIVESERSCISYDEDIERLESLISTRGNIRGCFV